MADQEKLDLVREALVVTKKLHEWADRRIESGGAPSPAEQELLTKLKAMLHDLKRTLGEF